MRPVAAYGAEVDAARSAWRWLTPILVCLAAASAARAAETRIGNAAISTNIVVRLASAATAPIQVGDDVFADENVKTGVDSAAKFVFSDQTNLAMGPTSQVKLDRFVYKGDTTYAKAAVNFAAGAFRFTTGGSDKRSYQLKTSTATIGVRGTVFDVLVGKGETTVTLVEGDVVICPRGRFDGDPRRLSKTQMKTYHCDELDKPGQTAVVTARSASSSGAAPYSFASSVCSGDAGLCSSTSSAALNPDNPALCYVTTD